MTDQEPTSIGHFRTDIRLKITCANCGHLLEADSSKGGRNCRSAYNMEHTIAIRPCTECMRRATEPLELMRKAMALIDKPEV